MNRRSPEAVGSSGCYRFARASGPAMRVPALSLAVGRPRLVPVPIRLIVLLCTP